ncbi:hypothetical protein BLA60_02290 [Actinophytocola xinjiangensis]|uniref:DUF4383 domain-containing protein n=1 Tax=Actinophytocola xinjiangensis TaxID=485602 RepID=A0A7Z0WSP6_9PSEU|nr:hypothetical protein BLA60_02290 [Actinophytocola xinjiangensis]
MVAVIAVVFLLAGVLGLAEGTVLRTSGLNSVVHLVFGLTGLAVVRSVRGSRRFLIAGGVLYVLWHYGAVTVLTSGSGGALNTANDWLNLWLAASMIALACIVGERPAPRRRPRQLASVEDPLPWRRGRAAVPSARPPRRRPAAGNRPRFAGAVSR